MGQSVYAGSQKGVQPITADILAQVGYCEPLLFCCNWNLAASNSELGLQCLRLFKTVRKAH